MARLSKVLWNLVLGESRLRLGVVVRNVVVLVSASHDCFCCGVVMFEVEERMKMGEDGVFMEVHEAVAVSSHVLQP
jgi:hypothetical protein